MSRSRKGKGKAKRKGSAAGGPLRRLGRALRALAFGAPLDEESAHRSREIYGLLMIGLGAWLLVGLFTYYAPYDDPAAEGRNWGGQVGFYLANLVFTAGGLAGYLFGVLSVMWGVVLLVRGSVPWAGVRLFGALCFVLSIAFLLELGLGERWDPSARMPYGPGGWLAREATPLLVAKFGGPGLWILMILLSLVSFMLATEMAFYPALRGFLDWLRERREERGESVLAAMGGWCVRLVSGLWAFLSGRNLEQPREREVVLLPPAKTRDAIPVEEEEAYADEEDVEYEDEDEEELDPAAEDEEYEYEYEEEEEEEEPSEPIEKKRPAARKGKGVAAAVARQEELHYELPAPPKGPWKYPPMDLLRSPERNADLQDRAIEDAANKLEHVLSSFRVEASVVGAQVGPTVTLYELEVAQGTRMNKVTQLSQEIAAALRAQSVRIIAPIPGKSTVGIEVPNVSRRAVRISELITKRAYDKSVAALPMFLGKDAEGNSIVEDLARMPHLLIAGTTGSGKSVCINTVLASVLLTRSPQDVQLILIDPKMVELQVFANIPHLMLPVVTDMRQATNVLLWAVEKMEGRYELFKNAGVRDIKTYNGLGEDKLRERLGDDWNEERTPRHVPYIMIVIDEFADMMMTSKKEAEQTVTRLAQKSRAVGIHVILATQRPSTDVITGVIKGNLPARIAFKVASKVDSRVIIDAMGAEKLLGGGDMLYTPPHTSRIKRVQGALVEDDELQGIIDFVCQESAPTFNQELVQVATGTAQPGSGSSESGPNDELWDDAVRVILKSRRGSASLLQRALGIGYTRASRLLDMMTEAGIVGAHKGSKAREILMTLDDWDEMQESPAGQGANHE